MSNRQCICTIAAAALAFLLVGSAAVLAEDFTPTGTPSTVVSSSDSGAPELAQADFGGYFRVYIVEPASRWRDASSNPYHYGFIDFAMDTTISINNGQRIRLNRFWDVSSAGMGGIDDDNIKAIAALFDDEPHTAYSYPPSSYPFTAYYNEATAAAVPGQVDSNKAVLGQTHTVFMDEATATDCGYCPSINSRVQTLYNNEVRDFHYVSMVEDVNSKAASYLDHIYNLAGTPTVYVDGGDDVLLGGNVSYTTIYNSVGSCGSRAVTGVGLMIKSEWDAGRAGMEIDIVFALGTPLNSEQAPPAQPAGPVAPMVDESVQFTASATDAEGDSVYYRWDWGDGQQSDWLGPFPSGVTCEASHSWTTVGDYDVTVVCRDEFQAESAPSTALTVAVQCCLVRGDADASGAINVSDLTYLVNYLFKGGPSPVCDEEGNADAAGAINVSDLTYLVNYLFKGGPVPPGCP